MRKALLIVAMLLVVTPVMAATTVKVLVNPAEQFTASDGNKVQPVSIAYTSTVDIRAFALDINIDAAGGAPNFQGIRGFKTGESTAASPGFGIFPSRFREFIVVTDPNWVNPEYNPTTAWNEPGTIDPRTGIGFPKMVVEMGTLYAGDINKPALSGTLFTFDVNAWGTTGTFHITIAANTLRGGVVDKDGNGVTATYEGNDVVFACSVPNVVSQDEAGATAAITDAGFTLGVRTTACSDVAGIVAGDIISTNPAAGEATCGIAVDYVVSTGPCCVVVPNLVGGLCSAANAAITGAGLTVGTVTNAYSDTVPAGTVISQNPVNPTCVALGTPVSYVCSLGPCVVPNVVNVLPADANTAITNAGFTVAVRDYNWSPTIAKGRTMAQTPAAGTSPGCGTAVKYTVSQGPTPVACFDPCGATFTAQKTQYNLYITNKWDPNSWCEFPIGSGFQCHGDADGKATAAPDSYRIFSGDLTIITAVNNWKKKIGVYPLGADPRADIDHKATAAPDSYRVFSLDLARLTSVATGNWKRKGCTSSTGTNLPRNCPLSDTKNNTYTKPVGCADTK